MTPDAYDAHMVGLARERRLVMLRTRHGDRPATLRSWDANRPGAQALIIVRVDGADILLPEATQ